MSIHRARARPSIAAAMLALMVVGLSIACHADAPAAQEAAVAPRASSSSPEPAQPPATSRLVAAARGQIGITRLYDPAYVELDYPGGDVSRDRGVCTDVVIRALRTQGLDLQQVIHEDMRKNFAAYPQQWGLKRANRSIDHRRVPPPNWRARLAVLLRNSRDELRGQRYRARMGAAEKWRQRAWKGMSSAG